MGRIAKNNTVATPVNKGGRPRTVHATAPKKVEVPEAKVEDDNNKTVILDNFDFAALLQTKARATNNGGDMVASLRKIDDQIELLKIGQTARIPVRIDAGKDGDKKKTSRAFLMSISGKIGNLTKKGREWAGRSYQTIFSPDQKFVYVMRNDDCEPVERKKSVRKPKATPVVAKVEDAPKLLEHKPEDKPSDVSSSALIIDG
jgi:hypothetical protein